MRNTRRVAKPSQRPRKIDGEQIWVLLDSRSLYIGVCTGQIFLTSPKADLHPTANSAAKDEVFDGVHLVDASIKINQNIDGGHENLGCNKNDNCPMG